MSAESKCNHLIKTVTRRKIEFYDKVFIKFKYYSIKIGVSKHLKMIEVNNYSFWVNIEQYITDYQLFPIHFGEYVT